MLRRHSARSRGSLQRPIPLPGVESGGCAALTTSLSTCMSNRKSGIHSHSLTDATPDNIASFPQPPLRHAHSQHAHTERQPAILPARSLTTRFASQPGGDIIHRPYNNAPQTKHTLTLTRSKIEFPLWRLDHLQTQHCSSLQANSGASKQGARCQSVRTGRPDSRAEAPPPTDTSNPGNVSHGCQNALLDRTTHPLPQDRLFSLSFSLFPPRFALPRGVPAR